MAALLGHTWNVISKFMPDPDLRAVRSGCSGMYSFAAANDMVLVLMCDGLG